MEGNVSLVRFAKEGFMNTGMGLPTGRGSAEQILHTALESFKGAEKAAKSGDSTTLNKHTQIFNNCIAGLEKQGITPEQKIRMNVLVSEMGKVTPLRQKSGDVASTRLMDPQTKKAINNTMTRIAESAKSSGNQETLKAVQNAQKEFNETGGGLEKLLDNKDAFMSFCKSLDGEALKTVLSFAKVDVTPIDIALVKGDVAKIKQGMKDNGGKVDLGNLAKMNVTLADLPRATQNLLGAEREKQFKPMQLPGAPIMGTVNAAVGGVGGLASVPHTALDAAAGFLGIKGTAAGDQAVGAKLTEFNAKLTDVNKAIKDYTDFDCAKMANDIPAPMLQGIGLAANIFQVGMLVKSALTDKPEYGKAIARYDGLIQSLEQRQQKENTPEVANLLTRLKQEKNLVVLEALKDTKNKWATAVGFGAQVVGMGAQTLAPLAGDTFVPMASRFAAVLGPVTTAALAYKEWNKATDIHAKLELQQKTVGDLNKAIQEIEKAQRTSVEGSVHDAYYSLNLAHLKTQRKEVLQNANAQASEGASAYMKFGLGAATATFTGLSLLGAPVVGAAAVTGGLLTAIGFGPPVLGFFGSLYSGVKEAVGQAAYQDVMPEKPKDREMRMNKEESSKLETKRSALERDALAIQRELEHGPETHLGSAPVEGSAEWNKLTNQLASINKELSGVKEQLAPYEFARSIGLPVEEANKHISTLATEIKTNPGFKDYILTQLEVAGSFSRGNEQQMNAFNTDPTPFLRDFIKVY